MFGKAATVAAIASLPLLAFARPQP
ncbi:MAG: hypothetical protein JWO66_2175, partial [Candidatus Eremiobacteraeota bacterium]|nr:hypothetical protein [Candidatus Eremiobacteraeota bacterium]